MTKHTHRASTLVWGAATAALTLAGCGNRAAEQQADALEDHADSVRAAGEQAADRMEDRADERDPVVDGVDSPAEQRVENQADRTREQAEQRADQLEDQADVVRDQAR